MLSSPDTRYRRKNTVVARQVVGETLLVPIRGDIDQMSHLFALNAVAAQVWEALGEEPTLDALVASVCKAFEVEAAQAEADVRAFVEQLLEADLIERL